MNAIGVLVDWISWLNVGLGVWLALTAFFFAHTTGTGVVEDLVAGLFVALAALWAARAFRPTMSLVASWTVVLSGLWAVAAPFTLGYERESFAIVNDIVVGVAIMALGTVNVVARARRIHAGGR
jgi:hypothetical protein